MIVLYWRSWEHTANFRIPQGNQPPTFPVRYKAANNQEVDPPTFPVCYKAAKNQEVDLLSGCSYYRKPGSTPGAGSMVARGTRRVQVTRAAYGPPRGECRILTNSWSPSDRCDRLES